MQLFFKKTVLNFSYESVVCTVYTVSGQSKYFNIYNSCTLYPMLLNLGYVLGLGSLYMTIYDNLCPMFGAIQESGIQSVSDRHQTPPHQLIVLRTIMVLRNFS